MSKYIAKLSLLTVVSIAAFSGCANHSAIITNDIVSADKQISDQRSTFRETIVNYEKIRIDSQIVDKPYIAGNSRPLARDVVMPVALRKSTSITALFQSSPVDLSTALNQLAEASGIVITTTPDALLPPSAFAIRMAGGGGEKSSGGGNPIGNYPKITLQAQNQPLWSILDDIARQASVSWRPVASGAEFYRLDTKIFYLSAISQSATTSASLGRNGGSNSAFDSQSKTSFDNKDQNLLKGVSTTIDALLTVAGKSTISYENQTVIVTDTKEALERVETFVKEQNKIMSRRVRVLIEAIEVTENDKLESGVDWNIALEAANHAISSANTTSLVGTQAGAFSFTRPANTGSASGSSLVIKALNEIGTVVSRRSFPFLTTSGRPITQAIRSTFNYVDQVSAQQTTASASTATTSTAPTVSQKDETVGTFITIVPTAKSDGTIFISISFDVTSAQPLVPFTVGSSGSSITVQQKTIDGTGVIQEVPIRSGQTVIIGGIETQTTLKTTRRLGNDVPMLLGGSNASKVNKSRMILLVTAVTEEGV